MLKVSEVIFALSLSVATCNMLLPCVSFGYWILVLPFLQLLQLLVQYDSLPWLSGLDLAGEHIGSMLYSPLIVCWAAEMLIDAASISVPQGHPDLDLELATISSVRLDCFDSGYTKLYC